MSTRKVTYAVKNINLKKEDYRQQNIQKINIKLEQLNRSSFQLTLSDTEAIS